MFKLFSESFSRYHFTEKIHLKYSHLFKSRHLSEDTSTENTVNVDRFSSLMIDEKTREKIENILGEYEYALYTKDRVSSTLSVNDMRDLLMASDFVQRRALMSVFHERQKRKIEKALLRRANAEARDQKWSRVSAPYTGLFDNSGELVYGLWHNSMFTRITGKHVSALMSARLRLAALFGQKIAVDLDFDSKLSIRECQLLAHQIRHLHNYNKHRTREPFDVHYVNCNPKGRTFQSFSRFAPNWQTPDYAIHAESYSHLFPRHKLVYLSKYANETVKTFSDDKVYVMSGAEQWLHSPLGYEKAKREGILAARIPIDAHVRWKCGNKSLSLALTLSVLHDVRFGAVWSDALRDNIPQRNLNELSASGNESDWSEKYKRLATRDRFG